MWKKVAMQHKECLKSVRDEVLAGTPEARGKTLFPLSTSAGRVFLRGCPRCTWANILLLLAEVWGYLKVKRCLAYWKIIILEIES